MDVEGVAMGDLHVHLYGVCRPPEPVTWQVSALYLVQPETVERLPRGAHSAQVNPGADPVGVGGLLMREHRPAAPRQGTPVQLLGVGPPRCDPFARCPPSLLLRCRLLTWRQRDLGELAKIDPSLAPMLPLFLLVIHEEARRARGPPGRLCVAQSVVVLRRLPPEPLGPVRTPCRLASGVGYCSHPLRAERRTSETTSAPSRSASLRNRSSVAVVMASMMAARMSEWGCYDTFQQDAWRGYHAMSEGASDHLEPVPSPHIPQIGPNTCCRA